MLVNEKCFICENKMIVHLKGRDLFMWVTEKYFDIIKCEKCGLEKISPTPTNNEIKNFYPPNYYSFNIREDKGILTRIKEFTLKNAYSEKKGGIFLSKILNFLIYFGLPLQKEKNVNFLDIGCGDGSDVELMSKYGWNSYGFDIGEKVNIKNIFFDYNIANVDFGKIKFDFIRIWHTMEHIQDPERFLEKIKEILNEGGEMNFCFPNTRSFGAVFFGKFWFGRDVPRHLYNYNLKNFRTLLCGKGLEIKKVKYCSINSLAGSLGFLASSLFKRKIDFFNNALVVLFFYPLEIMLYFLKISDVISCSVIIRKMSR